MLLKKLNFLFKYAKDEPTISVVPWRRRNSLNKNKIKQKPSDFLTDSIA